MKAYLDKEGYLRYRISRSTRAEMLMSYLGSKFPKNRFGFISFKIYHSLYEMIKR